MKIPIISSARWVDQLNLRSSVRLHSLMKMYTVRFRIILGRLSKHKKMKMILQLIFLTIGMVVISSALVNSPRNNNNNSLMTMISQEYRICNISQIKEGKIEQYYQDKCVCVEVYVIFVWFYEISTKSMTFWRGGGGGNKCPITKRLIPRFIIIKHVFWREESLKTFLETISKQILIVLLVFLLAWLKNKSKNTEHMLFEFHL